MTGKIHIERCGPVAVVVLDRPERKNAMNQTMWQHGHRAVEALYAALRLAVVVTGAGGAFCAGMDVNPDNPHVAGIMSAVQSHDRGPVAAMLDEILSVLDRLFALPIPVIAAINGLAYGGGAEMALRCDLRVMDPGAVICISETRLGLMPDWGGGVALARLVGPARAADLVLTARKLAAEEALALGVVNRVSQPGCARAEAVALAETIAKNGPRAVRSALAVIRRSSDLTAVEALAFERDSATSLIASGECVHGITAFLSRTPPTFPDVPESE
jgi:enoyl-CoA hydratase/carnithine racemase